MKWFMSGLFLWLMAPGVLAGPVIGFGAEGGFLKGYRNDRVTESGYPSPDHLKSLGGHIRLPLGSTEFALIGMFEWRTLLAQDAQGWTNLALDQVSTSASLRVPYQQGPLTIFVGGGPAGYRLRSHFLPQEGRALPTITYKLGGFLETGMFAQLPWHRAEAGIGLRHSLIEDPRVQGTLVWIGVTIWPENR